MGTKQIRRSIALPARLDHLVRSKVASGHYQSASEVVTEGLRLLEERDQIGAKDRLRMRHQIRAGWLASERGDVVDGPSVFAEIRRMSRDLRAKSKVRR